MTLKPDIKVWRYMSFAKLVWMLENKQLWLSNANFFEDKWEVMPESTQLNAIINNRPSSISSQEAIANTEKMVKELRNQTFVNCWNASDHESHALWRIYCPTSEGVAIQTTLDKLRKSVGLPVLEVSYDSADASKPFPDITTLVTQKRPMYSYEQEVRIVLVQDFSDKMNPDRTTIGAGISWDPELHLDAIWVHPDAQFWFIETVTDIVRNFAPKLSRNGGPLVWWSKMNSSPPF
jgi:hypothetical protein